MKHVALEVSCKAIADGNCNKHVASAGDLTVRLADGKHVALVVSCKAS